MSCKYAVYLAVQENGAAILQGVSPIVLLGTGVDPTSDIGRKARAIT